MFTTSLDFGEAALGGNALWLEVGVRPAGSEESWSILAPRQQVHSTPYSILSLSARSVADGSVTGSKISGGAVESHHLKEGAIGQQQLAEGAVVHSLNELSGAVAIVGEGLIRVSTVGNTVVLGFDTNGPGVDEVVRFEVVTRGGPPRGFDNLGEALAALEDHSILRIRGDCEVAAVDPRRVWGFGSRIIGSSVWATRTTRG